jgi:hypothetical protein
MKIHEKSREASNRLRASAAPWFGQNGVSSRAFPVLRSGGALRKGSNLSKKPKQEMLRVLIGEMIEAMRLLTSQEIDQIELHTYYLKNVGSHIANYRRFL